MEHLTDIHEIEQVLSDHRLCLFYIKAPDCGVCHVMLAKVSRLVDIHVAPLTSLILMCWGIKFSGGIVS